ncbi:hypothetical protein D6D01_07317 [Aureobasidium pullulans]|uniref:Uncharacterized protein n=1 Tax=Aureobasidium pullulans TaxID=5580 RepID=A0A4V4JTL6_AURPU|nr:hypothetical protein D6D01_07317 [Aureobasidium pullulans]
MSYTQNHLTPPILKTANQHTMPTPYARFDFDIDFAVPAASHQLGVITFLSVQDYPPTIWIHRTRYRYTRDICVTFVFIFVVNINMSGTEPAAAARGEFMQGVNGHGPDGRALPAGAAAAAAAAAARMVDQENEGEDAVPGIDADATVSGTEHQGKKKSLPRRIKDKVSMMASKIIKKT